MSVTIVLNVDGSTEYNNKKPYRVTNENNHLVDHVLFDIPTIPSIEYPSDAVIKWFIKFGKRGKDLLEETSDGYIWTLSRRQLSVGDNFIQVQAERMTEGIPVWQSREIWVVAGQSIDVDREISESYPEYLQEVDERVFNNANRAEIAADRVEDAADRTEDHWNKILGLDLAVDVSEGTLNLYSAE